MFDVFDVLDVFDALAMLYVLDGRTSNSMRANRHYNKLLDNFSYYFFYCNAFAIVSEGNASASTSTTTTASVGLSFIDLFKCNNYYVMQRQAEQSSVEQTRSRSLS